MILAIKRRYYLYLHHDRLGIYMLLAIADWMFVILLVIIAWVLIASFMVPVMYRRRCRAYEAFRAAVSLIAAHLERDCSLLFVSDHFRDHHWINQLLRDLCYLLHRRNSLYRNSDFVTGLCFTSFVLAFVFAAVCLGYDVWASFIPLEFSPVLLPLPAPPPPA